MTKLRDLARWLRAHDCEQIREGGSHSVWRNRQTGARSTVPRHREIPPALARAICDQLGVPRL